VDARRLRIPLGGDGARSLRVVAHFRALRPFSWPKSDRAENPGASRARFSLSGWATCVPPPLDSRMAKVELYALG
jgi:hypothetical protein